MSVPLMAVAGAVASAFDPCALPALPARLGARGPSLGRRVQLAADLLVLVVGGGLVVDGAGHFLDRLLLGA